MLQIRDICKEYRTGSLVQKALDHVSMRIDKGEFVSVILSRISSSTGTFAAASAGSSSVSSRSRFIL